ncbi:MAG: hypothetical protein WA705_19735 [Candidatus Ozemobacteraceae bacterium]
MRKYSAFSCVSDRPKRGRKPFKKFGHIREAKEILVKERAVHLDSLAERLKDPRVKKIVETILIGGKVFPTWIDAVRSERQ